MAPFIIKPTSDNFFPIYFPYGHRLCWCVPLVVILVLSPPLLPEGSARVEMYLKMQSSTAEAHGHLTIPLSPNKRRHMIRESKETDGEMTLDAFL